MADWLRRRERGVEVRLRIVPRAARDRVAGFYGDRLKLQITAPPVAGAANAAVAEFLARRLRVPKTSVRVVAGMKDRSKTLLIETADGERIERGLRRLAADVDSPASRS